MMNSLFHQEFTAFIGIDWADTKHDYCLQPANSGQRELGQFPHTVNGIDEWASSMHQRFGGTIAVALELSKGPIVYAPHQSYFNLPPDKESSRCSTVTWPQSRLKAQCDILGLRSTMRRSFLNKLMYSCGIYESGGHFELPLSGRQFCNTACD
jgi:hypothetical protein